MTKEHVPTDQAAPELLDQLRPIRDRIGRRADLYMRLSGFYGVGPDGSVEPEFGYRDMRSSEFRQLIQTESAIALADLAEPSAPAEVEGLVERWDDLKDNLPSDGHEAAEKLFDMGDDLADALTALQARAERAEAERDELLAAIGDWARPTGANGMTTPSEHHPLMVARAKLKGEV